LAGKRRRRSGGVVAAGEQRRGSTAAADCRPDRRPRAACRRPGEGTSLPERANWEWSREAGDGGLELCLDGGGGGRGGPAVCSRSRRCRAARISRTRRAAPARAKLICRGMARAACSQMASAAAGSHSAMVSSTTTAANSRRAQRAERGLAALGTSISIPSCDATTAAQLRAPSDSGHNQNTHPPAPRSLPRPARGCGRLVPAGVSSARDAWIFP